MKWPAQSPDSNPIENVWDLMKSHLRKLAASPRKHVHLFEILSKMWNSLPDSYVESLVASMLNRVEIVHKQRGRSTKY